MQDKIIHFSQVRTGDVSHCLCGCLDGKAMITTSLGRTNCVDCLNVARSIAKDTADFFAFFKQGIMQDGSVQEKRKNNTKIITEMVDQRKPYHMTFENCFISQTQTKRVSQVITSMHEPNFKEFVPVQKYIHGTINICDGHFTNVLNFHATDVTIEKSEDEIEEIKEELRKMNNETI